MTRLNPYCSVKQTYPSVYEHFWLIALTACKLQEMSAVWLESWWMIYKVSHLFLLTFWRALLVCYWFVWFCSSRRVEKRAICYSSPPLSDWCVGSLVLLHVIMGQGKSLLALSRDTDYVKLTLTSCQLRFDKACIITIQSGIHLDRGDKSRRYSLSYLSLCFPSQFDLSRTYQDGSQCCCNLRQSDCTFSDMLNQEENGMECLFV